MFAPPPPTYEWQTPGVRELQSAHGPVAYTVDRTPGAPRAIGLFFHGNACDLGSACVRQPVLALSRDVGLEMYVFDYCGYGLSGRGCGPSSDCTAVAAGCVLAHVVEQARSRRLPVLLIGHSLGSAVAARAAADLAAEDAHLVIGLMMLSAFVSPVGVKLWFLRGVTLYYDNHAELAGCARHGLYVLLATGQKDHVITPDHAKELHDRYEGPKDIVVLEGVNHSTIMLPEVLVPLVARVLGEKCGRAVSLSGSPPPRRSAPARPRAKPKPTPAPLISEQLLQELADQDLDDEFLALQLREELAGLGGSGSDSE